MKAWLLDNLTGLGALRLSDSVPKPKPAADEVLLRVNFAALNPADRFLAENLYPARPSFPHILGRDACGTIDVVGSAVRDFKLGDRVAILRNEIGVNRPGTFAEFVAVPADWIVTAPPQWSNEESAAAPLVYLTAHQALTQWGELKAARVIVTGASGGVGLAAIHLAKADGHRVIALSRGAAKADRLREQGADLVLDASDETLKTKTKEFTGGKGADLVVDNIGGAAFDRVLDLLGFGGRISVVGMLGGPVREFNTARLLFKRLRVGGVLVSDYTPDEARETWRQIVAKLDRAGKRPVVDSVFPFEKLPGAFERLAQGPFGKVLLNVTGSPTSTGKKS